MGSHRKHPFESAFGFGVVSRILTKLFTLWFRATHSFAAYGRHVSIHYTSDLRNTHLMKIGDYVSIHKDAWVHARSFSEQTCEPVLIIEDRCSIARRAHISAKNRIHLEKNVILAASVLIEDHGHAFENVKIPIKDQGVTEGGTIRIEEGCWIGHGAAIICYKGELVLGRNSVVGANAVVTRSCPPYSVLSGNPSRIVKQFDVANDVWVLGSKLPAPQDQSR